MKLTKPSLTLMLAGLGLAFNSPAFAHQTNVNLTPTFSSGTNYDNPTIGGGTLAYDPSGSLNNGLSALGANSIAPPIQSTLSSGAAITDPCLGAAGSHTGCYSISDATRFGWYNGTNANLGDSHSITGTPDVAIVYVSNPNGSVVNLTETQWTNSDTKVGTVVTSNPTPVKTTGLNPAFSVYSGLMYNLSHDDLSADPLIPAATDANNFQVTAVSPTDAAPNDPSIRSEYFDNSGNVINNPDWNKTFAQIEAESGHQDAGYTASGQNYNQMRLFELYSLNLELLYRLQIS